MKQLTYLLIFISMVLSINANSKYDDVWYDQPIKFNSRYVKNPEQVIVDALNERGWEIKDKTESKITAWLNNYKGYELLLDIQYSDSEISFKHISFEKLNCRKGRHCKADEGEYNKWRLYLRKSIAMNIHKLAIFEILKDTDFEEKWIKIIHSEDSKEKSRVAIQMMDYNFYPKKVLVALSEELESNYKKVMNGDDVLASAWMAKAITRSQDKSFRDLIFKIQKETPNPKLKRYVTNYIKENNW